MTEPSEKETDEIKRVYPWAVDWAVDCPHCNETIEGIDEASNFGSDYECPGCAEKFYIENGPI